MDREQIINLIDKGEGVSIEFKLAGKAIPADMYETVVSFSNTNGGTIFLGVTDDGEIAGINTSLKNKWLKDIVSALNSYENINPPLFIQPFAAELSGKMVIVLQIPVSSQVCTHKGKIYIREHESDINITLNQEQVAGLYRRKSTVFSENEIIPFLTMEDLDKDIFDKARQIIRSYQSDHPWLMVDNKSLLKEAVLWRKDFITGKEGLTLAAALIFGKDITIQNILPAYKTEVLVRKENKDRWDDRITLRTNLIDSYIQIKSFINKYLPEKFFMENGQRIDLRDKIFREVIGNVIVHREYKATLATEIIIDNYQVVATNPNRPHFIGPVNLDSFNPFAKNPNIRRFFTALGWTDEIGSGIRNTKKYLPLYVPGAVPVFIEDNIFKTVIPLNNVTLEPYTTKWVKWLGIDRAYAEHINRSLAKITLNPALYQTGWDGLLLNLIPGWDLNGTKLAPLDWPKKQPVTKEEIEKVPGWEQNSTRLLHKKIRYIIAILTLTAEPLNLDGIMKALGYSNKKTFRDNYIKPLEQVEFIKKTRPEKISAPDQKYQLTTKGALFLSNRS